MDRKGFIKKTLLGSIGLTVANQVKGGQAEQPELVKGQVGFNHLPNKEERTMKTVLHKANTRGKADHGWLNSYHSFSFANYYNPERTNFGALRVLNDDKVAPGMGFGKHPHKNMEIISIPLEGDLEHKDSMGTTAVIKKGDVQVMSAGTGIFHSEYNKNKDAEVKFLQIWVIPKKEGVAPRYDQITLKSASVKNELFQILSPKEEDEGVWIHQDAWFHLGEFDDSKQLDYQLKKEGNGVYAFVLEGEVTIQNQHLEKRDGFGVWDTPEVKIEATKGTKLLLMEVPMLS